MATYYVRTDGSNGASGANDSADPATGAWADVGYAASQATTAGDIVYVKSGTYTALTTSTANVAGGPCHLTANTALRFEGYNSSPGDGHIADLGANKPVIDVGAITAINVFVLDGSFDANQQVVRNIKVDGQSNATVNGFVVSNGYCGEHVLEFCETIDCVWGFAKLTGGLGVCISCKTVNGTDGYSDVTAIACEASGATRYGFYMAGSQATVQNSLARDCNVGFFLNAAYNAPACLNCTAEASTSHGFDPSYAMNVFVNCLATNNGGYGFDTKSDQQSLINCAGYNNTSGNHAHTPDHHDFTALTGDPYEAVGSDDYRPNNTAGAGADLRATGSAIPSQTTHRDIGAVQHTDPAGGGGGGGRLVGLGGGMIG